MLPSYAQPEGHVDYGPHGVRQLAHQGLSVQTYSACQRSVEKTPQVWRRSTKRTSDDPFLAGIKALKGSSPLLIHPLAI